MPLTWREHTLHMKWCLECHRNPEEYLRPSDRVFSMTWTPEDNRATTAELGGAVEELQIGVQMDDEGRAGHDSHSNN